MPMRKAPVLRRTLHNSCKTRQRQLRRRVLADKFVHVSSGFVPFV
jgi:hypothetical protein